jgi:hypothetical protein
MIIWRKDQNTKTAALCFVFLESRNGARGKLNLPRFALCLFSDLGGTRLARSLGSITRNLFSLLAGLAPRPIDFAMVRRASE